MKTAAEVRSDFLDFFRSKQHHIVPSAPIIPQNDPTLLFTNAGMNQFKDVFLGTGTRPYRRAADTQKCLRVSGKHNDLEVVGRDTYHHTFFEMLGNWSFGDYFKKEAIGWAWELLTKIWGLPKDRLWATVFAGDEKDHLPADDEAFQLWHTETDIVPDHILKFGRKDNFWEMGETGPCGPCSEIHIDLGPGTCNCSHIPDHQCQVNAGCSRFMEIWNLVFIQFNRQEDQSLVSLPAKHVDTGMGFERLLAVMQQKRSNYDTDLFAPILAKIAQLTGRQYQASDNPGDIAFRVIADHIRTLCSAFADGALPSNTGRGYVLRRILRRASRFGRQNLEMPEPFLFQLVDTVAEIYHHVFPEIQERKEHIKLLIQSEEESFSQMLTRGIRLFNEIVADVKKQGQSILPGEKVYRLYQQDGFPKDLVELMARDECLVIDEQGWTKAEQEHMDRSRGEKTGYEVSPALLEGLPSTKFLGYSTLECTSQIVKLLDNRFLILEQTPFYAEAGGQVGDIGVISGPSFKFKVTDTQKIGDIYVHFGEVEEQDLTKMPKHVTATVDKERRHAIMANHTATHLLHYALREVLGKHVAQQGSVVLPDRLRFDISHPQKITDEELVKVEEIVNRLIYENLKVRKTVEPLEVAKKRGATALFGEKYGDKVRVIQIGRYSMELCGGTHTYFTGDLGYFRIVAESSIQAGVRRIEAVTRQAAVALGRSEQKLVRQIKEQLKVSEEQLVPKILALQEEIKELKKKSAQQSQKDTKQTADQILAKAPIIQGVKVITTQVESMPPTELRVLADMIKKSSEKAAGMLATVHEGKVFIVAFVSDLLAPLTKVHAGELIKLAGPIIGGGGDPRRPEFSQGQGTKCDAVESMLQQIQTIIQEKLAAI